MTIVQDPVKNAIWRFLNHYAYSDALFLAERLFAEVHSDEALFLLATTYYRLGKPKVVEILFEKHGLHQPQCKLLYAQACWDLENYAKAEQALIGSSIKLQSVSNALTTFQSEYGESACFAAALLGRIYLRTERPDWAEKCFTKSLQLNPFLWSSFEKMCEAGCKPNPTELFNVESLGSLQSKVAHSTSLNVPSASHAPPSSQIRKKKSNSAKVLVPSQVGSNVDINPSNIILHFQDQQMQPNYTSPQTVPPSINDEENMGGFDRKISSNDGHFLRSTPSETSNWDSSADSITASHHEKYTKTQLRISHSLLGGTGVLSPLTPSIGVMPLYETPSPTWDRDRTVANSNTTPADMAPPTHDLNPPVKKMVTRQSKKIGDASTAAGKLFLSSENSRRDSSLLHISTIDSSMQSTVVATRRSTRFSNTSNSVKENAKKTAKGKSQPKDVTNKKITRLRSKQATADLAVRNLADEISKVDSSAEKSKGQINMASPAVTNPQKEAAENLIKLFQNLGTSLLRLCQYDCKKAEQCIEQLPPNQRNTSWVLSLLAKCYFELTDYKQAAKVFQELRRDHPHHITGLAYYSTTLWHLHDSVALSALAHDLVKIDALSPETWCAVGNCFSLKRDYDSSIKFFARAVQLAPHYAYGHTLLGHEYAYSEDHERAMACFRKAIHCDSRHYNAWYGIGSIYYKQENFALAEIHFRKALTINQYSSVLLCHLGIVQHAQKRSAAALRTLKNALVLEPLNPLCKFHKASILFATERHKEALNELLELKQIVPKESLVYFLIGKTYKVLGENHLAMMNFSWALDLDPKGANNHIKEAIDKQQGSDDMGGFSRRNESSQELMDSVPSQDEDDSVDLEGMQDSDESL